MTFLDAHTKELFRHQQPHRSKDYRITMISQPITTVRSGLPLPVKYSPEHSATICRAFSGQGDFS